MFLNFFLKLKESRIPVSLNEFLTFLGALNSSSILYNFDNFYFLARSILVKDEKLLDTFDVIFGRFLRHSIRLWLMCKFNFKTNFQFSP